MDAASSYPEARTGVMNMDGTLMNLAGLLVIDVRLGSGDDEYAGSARYLDAGRGADDIQILSYWENDVRGGPGNDLMRSDREGFRNIQNARGGPGDDTISHALTIWGGPGEDFIDGASDAKIIEGTGPNGADTIIGRSDTTVVYSGRTADIVVRMDGKANDGEAGEHDNVMIGLITSRWALETTCSSARRATRSSGPFRGRHDAWASWKRRPSGPLRS